MTSGDTLKADLEAASVESREDDAWIEACRAEADAETTPGAEATDDPETSERPGAADENEDASSGAAHQIPAIEKTGDDAMSKFGHAIGAIAEDRFDDLDNAELDQVAEMASPSKPRDADVAPYIANAERELAQAKSSGPVDIFDRIAQAAESQFDETRGNTAKRVSELVDDRRVGTKRWTPSKTMKQRMEKLEAARAAASDTPKVATAEAAPAPEAVVEPVEAVAAEVEAKPASAPMSAAAVMVTPNAKKAEAAVETAKAEPAPVVEEEAVAPEERVVISRKDRQADIEEDVAEVASDEEIDPDELRVVPGARGRRRDRARKSRLDEDFEKIFDDEGKPSIGSLRRKLRSGAPEDSDPGVAASAAKPAAVTEETFGAVEDAAAPKKAGLFASLFKGKGKKAAEAEMPADAEAAMVDAFEADAAAGDLGFDDAASEDWEQEIDRDRKQKAIMYPMIGGAALVAIGGLIYVAYKFLLT